MKTLWHRLLAKLLETLLVPEEVTVLSELPATSNPPEIDILLLRRAGAEWTPAQRALLPDGVRDRQMAHHLLECKITESVTEQSLLQALTYDYLYRQSQQLAEHDVQTYVVSAQTPQAAKLTAWGYTEQELPGVYVSTAPLLHKVVLLVLNQLRAEPHNEYIQLFASRQRVRQRALVSLGQVQPTALWTVILALQKAYDLKGADMSAEMTFENLLMLGEETRKKIIASATLAERLAGLSPGELEQWLAQNAQLRREVVAHAPAEERLEGLAPKERLEGLAPEERLVGLSQQELLVLLKQIEVYLQGQQSSTDMPPTAPTQ